MTGSRAEQIGRAMALEVLRDGSPVIDTEDDGTERVRQLAAGAPLAVG